MKAADEPGHIAAIGVAWVLDRNPRTSDEDILRNFSQEVSYSMNASTRLLHPEERFHLCCAISVLE